MKTMRVRIRVNECSKQIDFTVENILPHARHIDCGTCSSVDFTDISPSKIWLWNGEENQTQTCSKCYTTIREMKNLLVFLLKTILAFDKEQSKADDVEMFSTLEYNNEITISFDSAKQQEIIEFFKMELSL